MRNEHLTSVIRFGSFDLDLKSGELRSGGRKVHLQEQPFRILELLSATPGQLVSREEIRRRLWPNDTIVEFENAVNAAVKKLRIALGDAADEPRYVETVKRRGYRLIVPVAPVSGLTHPEEIQTDGGLSQSVQGLAGRRVSHYRVIEKIGGGGMGVVYRAEDIRLGRRVALKFLPDDLARNPIALQRFRMEACSASALNHPNICTIFGIEEHAGEPFIVMELLEGNTLRDRISGGPLSSSEVLEYASQIADGLVAAHREGIVHRDIKPANIFITTHAHAKILDFGLAKTTGQSMVSEMGVGKVVTDPSNSPTTPGDTPGTAVYMSPEQVLGKPLDSRTDLFSFGVVLYEMATRRTPFRGVTDEAVFDAILNETPSGPIQLNPELPPGLDRIVTHCLEKDRDLRYQHALDIRADIQKLKRETDSGRAAAITEPHISSGVATHWKMMAALAAAVLALFVAFYLHFHEVLRSTPKLTDRDRIVLADFINKTGDPVFDETLRQGLAVELEQSPFLSLMSEEHIQRALGLMRQPPDTRLTPELALEICERTQSAAVLEGSVARLGSQYVLGLHARDCRTGDVLDEEQVQAARKEDVLAALGQIAGRFRTRVGETLATVEKHSTPLTEATTPSLEALKAYSAARRVHASSGGAAALLLYKRAIQMDPEFAMAYAYLGHVYGELGETDLAAQSTSKAYQLRDRASDQEEFFISASYDLRVTGNLDKLRRTCEAWAQVYPREMNPHAFLAGHVYQVSGNYEMAKEEAKKSIELDPDFAVAYDLLAFSYENHDQFGEAKATIQRASDRKLDLLDFWERRYNLAFLTDDKAGMEREVALSRGTSDAEDLISDQQALSLAYEGHLQQARSMSKRAADLAQQTGQMERSALYRAGAALREAFFGNVDLARDNARAALKLSRDREVVYGAALALAISGDSAGSSTLALDLDRRFGEDTSVQFNYLPTLNARIAMNHRDLLRAIELLQVAAPYEMGQPRSRYHGFFGSLYPIYMRGEVYLAANRGAEAAVEFQKILDHRGIVVNDPIGALAHVGLARAYALGGEAAKARSSYQDFLSLWKDADRGIPLLKQVRFEYARLPGPSL